MDVDGNQPSIAGAGSATHHKLAFRYSTHKNSKRAAKKRQRRVNSKLASET